MKVKIWAALITVYIVWGSTYLAIRFAVDTLPPFLMAATRFLIAGGILFGWRMLAGDAKPVRIEWRSAIIVGLLLLVGGNGGVVWAEQFVPSGVAALIVGTAPIWMVLIDALRPNGRKANWQTWAGVIVGFIGIVFLISPWEVRENNPELDTLGILALLLAAFLWAIGSLYSRGAKLPDSPLLGTGMEMLAGGVGLLILGIFNGEWARLDPGAFSARSIWSLIYLIFIGALLGFAAYTWLLRNAPTPLVATYAYVNPLVAVILGSLLAAEPLTPKIIVTALIVVGSVGLINTARVQPKKIIPSEPIITGPGND